MEGPFLTGNFFILKPKGIKAFKIILTSVEEGHAFTDCTSFLGAKMYDTHNLTETTEVLLLTNTLSVTGPLKWLWIFLVAKNVARSVPEEMESLVKFLRKTNV